MTTPSFLPKRPLIFSLASLFIGCTITIVALEIILRFFPVSDSRNPLPVNQANPILHFEPDRDFLYSKGWNFTIIANKHSNNYGFLNDSHYVQNSGTPLIAIIGDSFVEARQVENRQAMHGILSSLLKAKCRVYSFGASGAPLSQYLAYAEYVQNEFLASRMVFIIVGNDFDESLIKYRGRKAFHYFSGTPNNPTNTMDLQLIEYHPKKTAILLRQSALARYLSLNLGIKQLLQKDNTSQTETEERLFVGNTLALAEEERVKDSQFVVETFFNQLPMRTGLSPSDILFILDGIRPQLYSEQGLKEADGSYFFLMKEYFMKYAISKGYEVIDMQPLFIDHYKQKGVKFEFNNDAHWNEFGHRLVADSIHQSTSVSGLHCSQ